MNSLFNEYGIKARVFPAILCAMPFLVLKHFLIDPYFDLSITDKLFAGIMGDISLTVILIYLLVQINRLVSKLIFENKSNFPTSQMLLASSFKISREFRSKISQKIEEDFNLSLPTLADEKSNIENAKNRISEIVHLIINKVGDGVLLLQHNIEYGFTRNLIGGSLISFVVSFACIIIFSFIFQNKIAYIISITLSVLYTVPIIFSKTILKHYSEEYARVLFREYLG